MKKIKYILIVILCMGMFNSCIDNSETFDLNKDGYNLAGFEQGTSTISGIADGTEYTFYMKVKVVGPTVRDLTSDITLTVAVDTASTAIEGTHFNIPNPTVVLTKSNNYLGLLEIKMTTEGIVTPLPENPVIVLNAINATGDSKVISNGKPLQVTMNFACFTELDVPTYNVHIVSSSGGVRDRVETITKIDVETYKTYSVGTWNGAPFQGNGYIFTNSCNVLDVPLSLNGDLADTYSNDVWGHLPGSLDPATGVITLYYTIWFAAGNVTYTAIYTPQ
jgi:hypothetical protein